MCEMFTQDTLKGWFVVCSLDSVSVLEFECNEEIWEEISGILVELYDKEDIKKPTKLPPNFHNLLKSTEQYGKDSIKIVA